MPREDGTRGQPHRLHHRQPEREKRRKRGACIDPHGFDAGKLIKGKKRHILVDMQGLLLHAIVHSACVQDRDGGIWLLATLFGQFPFSQNCSPTAPTRDQFSIRRSPKSRPTSKPKSSNAPIVPKGSCHYPSVGSSNVRSLG